MTSAYLINNSFSSWQDDPVAASIVTHPVSELEFPRVTVCPPEGSNTAHYYDLMKADNESLSLEDRQELRRSLELLFIESWHMNFIKKIAFSPQTLNQRDILNGIQNVTKPYGEFGMEIISRSLNGSMQRPRLVNETELSNSNFMSHIVLDFPENIADTIGNGRLVVNIEMESEYDSIAYNEGSRYTGYKKPAHQWLDAEIFCQEKGGHLASVHSLWEQDDLTRAVAGKYYVWLGASYNEKLGTWQWTDGSGWGHPIWDVNKNFRPGGKNMYHPILNCTKQSPNLSGWSNNKCSLTLSSRAVCATDLVFLGDTASLTLEYTRDQVTFPFLQLWHRAVHPGRGGFKLTWFIEESKATENSATTTAAFATAAISQYQEPFLTKMVNFARKSDKTDRTRKQMIDEVNMEKARLLSSRVLKFETMCFGGLVKPEYYRQIFEAFDIETEDEQHLSATAEEIRRGSELFGMMVLCPEESIQLYQFFTTLVSQETPRTLLLALVNTLQSNKISLKQNRQSLNNFYLALNNMMDLQLGKILSTILSPAEVTSMKNHNLPYFDGISDKDNICLNEGSNTVGKWKTQEVSLHPPHLIDSDGKLTPGALIPFCAYQTNLSLLGSTRQDLPFPVCDKFKPTMIEGQLCYSIDLSTNDVQTKNKKGNSLLLLLDPGTQTIGHNHIFKSSSDGGRVC